MATNNNSSSDGFAAWRRATGDNLMSSAEELLEKLEDVADTLLEIDDAYRKETSNDTNVTEDAIKSINNSNNSSSINSNIHSPEATRQEMVARFHEGVENARRIIGVLKREKWRLSRREMSVEMRMGELEEYKSHLQSDMTSLNQTVEVLSMRIVQLENQLAEAQEQEEQLRADLADTQTKLAESQKQKEHLKKSLSSLSAVTPHTLLTENAMVKNEIAVLLDENKKLKELIRTAESQTEAASDEHLTRLTRDFLRQLSSLDEEESLQQTAVDADLQATDTKVKLADTKVKLESGATKTKESSADAPAIT